MALAPFFDKAALSAAGILKGFERIEFARNLEAHCIGIHIASSSLQSFEGTTAVEMAVNLIARLYPRFSVWSTAETDSVRIERLVRLARSINPGIEVEHPTAATLTLVIGESEQRHKSAYYIGSDGWIAKCSASRPLNSGDTDNPFGAAAAACIGAANIFRIVF